MRGGRAKSVQLGTGNANQSIFCPLVRIPGPSADRQCAMKCAFLYRCMCTSWWFTGGCNAAPGGGEICPEGGREARPGSDGGLNEQSGLKCTGHAPSPRGPGYRRVYGETTKHALEASVLTPNPLMSRMGWRGQCHPIRPGLHIWAGRRAQTRLVVDKLSYSTALGGQG